TCRSILILLVHDPPPRGRAAPLPKANGQTPSRSRNASCPASPPVSIEQGVQCPAVNALLVRPDPGNERFGLGPFFRVEPLGLEYVAAALRAGDVPVAIVDERFARAPGRWLRRSRAGIVGISCTHALEYDRVREVARMIRSSSPQSFVVVGGHAAGACSAPLEVPEIDAICLDDGEQVLPAVASALKQREPLVRVPGLRLRMGDAWVTTPPL